MDTTRHATANASAPRYNMRFRVKAIAIFIDDAKEDIKASKSDYVALKRLNPASPSLGGAEIAALTHVALRARLEWEHFTPEQWKRWALIAHGIALAGHDSGAGPNEGPKSSDEGRLGKQLFKANVSEARVLRLLDSRGVAFVQTLPRLLRLMASRGVAPNWVELGNLVLYDDVRDERRRRMAEALRLRIAGDYFSAVHNGKDKQ